MPQRRGPAHGEVLAHAQPGASELIEVISGGGSRHLRPHEMALDVDPTAAAVRAHFAGWDLDRLRSERARLEQVLSAAPPDVSAALAAAIRRRDALVTWRRTLLQPVAEGAGGWRGRLRRDATARRRQLEAVARSLDGLTTRIDALATQLAERRRYFLEHRDDYDRLRLVVHAEQAQVLRARTGERVVSTLAPEHDASPPFTGNLAMAPERPPFTADVALADADVVALPGL